MDKYGSVYKDMDKNRKIQVVYIVTEYTRLLLQLEGSYNKQFIRKKKNQRLQCCC